MILDRLRAAAPNAEIIVIGGWNSRIDFLAESDPLFQAANTTIAAVAARARARFSDMVPIFNPEGEGPRLVAICALTLLCAEGDGHPSDAGYRAMAEAVFEASGYARLRLSCGRSGFRSNAGRETIESGRAPTAGSGPQVRPRRAGGELALVSAAAQRRRQPCTV